MYCKVLKSERRTYILLLLRYDLCVRNDRNCVSHGPSLVIKREQFQTNSTDIDKKKNIYNHSKEFYYWVDVLHSKACKHKIPSKLALWLDTPFTLLKMSRLNFFMTLLPRVLWEEFNSKNVSLMSQVNICKQMTIFK